MAQGVGDDLVAVVPTLGASAALPAVIEALREQGGAGAELIVVHSGPQPLPPSVTTRGQVVRRPDRLGFAAAVNLGLAASVRPWVVVINDDAIPEAGWLTSLRSRIEGDASLAAVQGTNLTSDGERVDGRGIVWTRSLQAVQLDRGRPASLPDDPVPGIFGVSATACLLRREALAKVAFDDGRIFDEHLDTYYEDVDLAGRLRARGWPAATSTAARVRHRDGASSAVLGRQRLALLYSNRHLVLARLLGPGYAAVAARVQRQDLRDLVRHPTRAREIASGWRRVHRLLPRYRSQEALLTVGDLRSFPAR